MTRLLHCQREKNSKLAVQNYYADRENIRTETKILHNQIT